MKTATNNGYSPMPATQPTANSLQANAPCEFAVTSHSQSFTAIQQIRQAKIERTHDINFSSAN